MLIRTTTGIRVLSRSIALVAVAAALLQARQAGAQVVTTGTYQQVGGVMIDPQGVLQNASVEARNQLHQVRAQALQETPAELAPLTPYRKVSLRGLDEALARAAQDGRSLPDAMKYLAGLQAIEYVLVYPELHDVVLVGPGESWKLDGQGNLVGTTTGRPVLTLDDLVVALRSARQAAQGGISCSIDPTAEGLTRLRAMAAKLGTIGADPQATATSVADTLGPQTISVHGVPGGSHFARVLVAADYRMKRLAMAFDPPPIRGLPSFLQMVPVSRHGMNNMLPRWWLTPVYDPVVRDAEGLAWQVGAAQVKAMTEEDFLGADGSRQHTGRAGGPAQKWADTMTARYDALALADPIFGELRSCMNLALVAALITKEDLLHKAGCSVPLLVEPGKLTPGEFSVPRQVASQASLIRRGTNWVISASGGVQINSYAPLHNVATGKMPAELSRSNPPARKSWWWN